MPNVRSGAVFAVALAIGCAAGLAFARDRASAPRRGLQLDVNFGDSGTTTFSSLGTQRLDSFDRVAASDWEPWIYVAGSHPAPAVARFDLHGSADESFGTVGIAVLHVVGSVESSGSPDAGRTSAFMAAFVADR